MSTEPFVGEVKLFGFYFAPLSYMTCQGQLLNIAQYSALYALLGTTFGGNGQTTFGLPNLQGRMPIGQGTGPGLPSYSMGEMAGAVSLALKASDIPMHSHTLNNAHVKVKASTANAGEQSPDSNYPATTATAAYADSPTAGIYNAGAKITGTTDISGSGIPFSILNPFLTMNYSIAVEGIFPSRN
jgi:microcystin-dependent protein